ncbi:unnamed protein product [Vitrella brassicaformis CCMP3155]|uniref:Protein kinase domain-containing protein n=1 Tax=Vitrella brassicaformis (strain CCMP3155) TaxID=1169540 RepID=A0A0G4EM50_VITBC|nr:unnamed protein product [Vitrella brassicaformis CCMP3155]|eukprot:CEL98228.1 unnamed protein product [Vitrella brassicaformis CCMP3155]
MHSVRRILPAARATGSFKRTTIDLLPATGTFNGEPFPLHIHQHFHHGCGCAGFFSPPADRPRLDGGKSVSGAAVFQAQQRIRLQPSLASAAASATTPPTNVRGEMRALKRLGPVRAHIQMETLALERAMALNSPSIAPVKQSFSVRQDGSPPGSDVFMEMAVYRQNLRQYAAARRTMSGRSLIDEQEAKDLLYPLVVCLRDLLDKCGLIHGDVKSANVMVDGEDEGAVLKFIDFGNAHVAHADKREALNSKGAQTLIQDDIRGLGHLLGELLYGPPRRRGCCTHFNRPLASAAAYDLYDKMMRRPHTLTYEDILSHRWFAREFEGYWKPPRQPAADQAPPPPPATLEDHPAAQPSWLERLRAW